MQHPVHCGDTVTGGFTLLTQPLLHGQDHAHSSPMLQAQDHASTASRQHAQLLAQPHTQDSAAPNSGPCTCTLQMCKPGM